MPNSTQLTRKSLTRSASKSAEYTATLRSQSKLARTKHRFGSVGYWKFMYEQSQNVIQESYEKSMKLDEIPGLLIEKLNLKRF